MSADYSMPQENYETNVPQDVPAVYCDAQENIGNYASPIEQMQEQYPELEFSTAGEEQKPSDLDIAMDLNENTQNAAGAIAEAAENGRRIKEEQDLNTMVNNEPKITGDKYPSESASD